MAICIEMGSLVRYAPRNVVTALEHSPLTQIDWMPDWCRKCS